MLPSITEAAESWAISILRCNFSWDVGISSKSCADAFCQTLRVMDAAIPRLDRTESLLLRWVALSASTGKIRIVFLSVLLTLLICILDHAVEPSLGVFYIVPMILAATVLSPIGIIFMALVCASFYRRLAGN